MNLYVRGPSDVNRVRSGDKYMEWVPTTKKNKKIWINFKKNIGNKLNK